MRTKTEQATPSRPRPLVAIIDANTLSVLGLRHILQSVMPFMQIEAFNSFDELEAHGPDAFYHYFVAVNIVLANRAFFLDRRHKTIVLTASLNPNAQLSGFHSICVALPEDELIRSLLRLEQHAHAHGRNLPAIPSAEAAKSVLSGREIEVLSLVVRGRLNKEIADMLHISMPTVASHRKNIVDKLGLRSVSALTIYAVTNGYVDVNEI